MGNLYTVGHSTFPKEHLIGLLRKYDVDYLLDVRSIPFSKYTPQYNSDFLKKYLFDEGINYATMGKYFGARQENPAFYPDGFLDFELFRASTIFIQGFENVNKGLIDHNIALMCTEKDPIDCHRAIMVARGFELQGVTVRHILHDSAILTQEDLNQKLLNRYFPDRGQLSLFREQNKTDEEYLAEAYKLRNKEIGYRKGSDKEGGVA